MIQLNTPYPATAYLTGFLRQHAARLDLTVSQADPAIDLFLRIFCREGIQRILDELTARAADPRFHKEEMPASIAHFLAHGPAYVATVDAVVRFLQGRDPALALRIAGRGFLPEGPRFSALRGDAYATAPASGARRDAPTSDSSDDSADELAEDPAADPADDPGEDSLTWAFGALGTADRAKHLATLYIDDLADVVRDGIQPHFELSRYGERLAASAASFDHLHDALEGPSTLLDSALDDIARELCVQHRPDLVGLTAPFPGNVYGAFRIARSIRATSPATRIVLGGGFVNTELRELSDPRVFDYVDYVTLDDGERPLLALIEHLREPAAPLLRTFVRDGGRVVLRTDPTLHDIPLSDAGTPTYDGLPLDRYLSLFEMLNPMHRLWSDGRWNKLTIAHGCYWKKCTFCDVTLDYIERYDLASADLLVDRIQALIAETGQTGFHFVDEAAPPAGLRALAERLIARKVVITWWSNIRFEKTFTPELTRLLARSGCVAISGGLEVASDRLLGLIKKGVTVEQVARVTRAFTQAGVMVHAYLMYGFPSETTQETIDSLERVRQLFVADCVQSAFWHRFAATAHSPIGKNPGLFGIRLRTPPGLSPPGFARNDLPFDDPTGTDHDFLGVGLRRALYNYMLGIGLDLDVRTWFPPIDGDAQGGRRARTRRAGGRRGRSRARVPATVPATTVAPDFIAGVLARQ